MSMSKKHESFKALYRHLPDNEANAWYVVDLIHKFPLIFKIVKPRKTKLGDFRAGSKHTMSRITVNGNLNPYSFMITTIHEIAHFFTFLENKGRRVKPHGQEWQNCFKKLLNDIPNFEALPHDVRLALINYMRKPKASSCTDTALMRVLNRYDKDDDKVYLEQLKVGSHFQLEQHTYKIIGKARTRYLCNRLPENNQYKVHALARVWPLED